MKNICYILSGIDKALAFEWITERLNPSLYTLHFVLLHSRDTEMEAFLRKRNIPHARVQYASKMDVPKAVWKTYLYIQRHKIDVVHAHLLDAGLVGMLAARIGQVPMRLYTRHYSTYHHAYHPKGVWYDKLINALSTRLIAVSPLVKTILMEKEGVSADKITVVPHGFPLEKFDHPSPEKIATMKQRRSWEGKFPVVGVVARYTEWKGIQYIIPAFAKLLERYPNAHLVLANAKGDYMPQIAKYLLTVPAQSVTEIVFENDLFTLFKTFDLFIHVPINHHAEAFGQVYIEALAAGIPSIFTLSGIANNIAQHEQNALIVNYKDSENIYLAALRLLEDEKLRARLAINGQETVMSKFGLDTMIHTLEAIYGNPYTFSVIVPTYNRAEFLPKTLASVLAQTYPHFEVIVVDDGSTDPTQQVMAGIKDPRIRYHYKKNEERGKARNTGMDLAQGDYITFLDSDDLLYPNHLAHAAQKLAQLGSPSFYRQAYEVRTEDGTLVSKMNKVSGDANLFILGGNYFSCIGVFLKKEVALDQRFSEDRLLSPSEDWEYWLRLSVRYPIYYDNTITACLINHKQRSVNHFNERHSLTVIAKFVGNLKNDPVFMEKRGKYLNKIRAQMYTLMCLNKVIAKQNTGVLTTMLHAYRLSISELFKRRTLAILKIYVKNILHV